MRLEQTLASDPYVLEEYGWGSLTSCRDFMY